MIYHTNLPSFHSLAFSFPTERSDPVNDNEVVAAGKGIVHLNTGDAGAGLYKNWLATPDWSAFHSAAFGFGRLTIYNSSVAHWVWTLNGGPARAVDDEVWITNVVA